MAPVDLNELSSNWKKLQRTLQKEPEHSQSKTAATSNTLKRKAGNEARPIHLQNGVKRVKKNRDAPKASIKRAKHSTTKKTMDDIASSSSTTKTTTLPAVPFPLDTTGLNTSARLGKYISLDCEMVGTGPPPTHNPSILARVSIVTYQSTLLYDTYVLPYPAGTRITDYRTAISGITPFHISSRNPSARPFELVQQTVAEILQGRVLIGHALKHDLEVLGLKHPRRDIRDTARYPEWRKLYGGGRTPGLRKLAMEILGWEIQGGQHSSVEDARAAMELWKGEKKGFEREHVQRWGLDRRVVVGGKMVQAAVREKGSKAVTGPVDGLEGAAEDDEDDEETFDGEDGEVYLSEAEGGEGNVARASQLDGAALRKKKKKRKKRTKR